MADPNEYGNEVAAAFDAKAAELGLDPDDELPLDDETTAETAGTTETAAEVVAETQQAAEAPAEGATVATEDHLAPHTWPAEWKETFNKLAPEAKAISLQMNAFMEQGFQKKMGMLGKKGRELDSIERAVKPHMDRLHRAGLAPEIAIQRALAWDLHIQQNGAQGLADMAKAYGFDPAQIQPQGEQEYMTPTERSLKKQLEAVLQQVNGFQQNQNQWTQQQQEAWQRQQEDWAVNTLQQFVTATDPSGKPLHPHVPRLQGMMARLINSRLAGSLDEAYEMAENLDPETRAARQRQAAMSQADVGKVEQVRKASNVGSGIVTKPTVQGGKMKEEDFLAAEYSKKRRA